MKKIIINGDIAHFKIPLSSEIQRTYKIPPISTIVGMLQNIYGKDINNFVFGYIIQYKSIETELVTVYKEFNLTCKRETDRERFTKAIMKVENLINPRLILYTNIEKEIKIESTLVLGKTNYLAKIMSIEDVELINNSGSGYNQYTSKNVGDGMIKRINTLTEYNQNKGCYQYTSELVRENEEFKYDHNYEEVEEQNIFLWSWKDGKVNEFKLNEKNITV